MQFSNDFPFPTGDNSHAPTHQADPTDDPSPRQLHPETIGFKRREHPGAHGPTKLPARNCHSVISKDIHKAQHSRQKTCECRPPLPAAAPSTSASRHAPNATRLGQAADVGAAGGQYDQKDSQQFLRNRSNCFFFFL